METKRIHRRPPIEDDRLFAKNVHHAAYHDVIERQFGTFNESEQDDFFAKSWDTTPHEVMERDGHRVGYCSIQHLPDHIFVHTLVVAPEYQNQGIGREVLEGVMTEARARGIPARLRVLKQNRAQELYKKVGFRMIEEQKAHYVMEYSPLKVVA